MNSVTFSQRLARWMFIFLCNLSLLLLPRNAMPCAGSSSLVCVVNPAACLISMSIGKSVTNTVVFPPGGPALVNVGFTLNITCPLTNNCGNACPNPGGPTAASITVDLYPGPPCPPLGPSPAPTAATTLSTATGTMVLPTCAPTGPLASFYNVGVTVPAGTPPGLYCVVGTATVTFPGGLVLTQTGDTVVCLVESAPGQPGVPRLGLELITDGNLVMSPGDQAVARYRVVNNDDTHTVQLTALATSKQTAVRPQGANELDGVFAISHVFGDDYPIMFDPGAECIVLPPHPYTQPPISQTLPELAPGESTIVEVGIRSYGQCADGSCSESTMRVEGTFGDGAPALACAGMSLIVDTSVPSINCGSEVNDCNQNGIPDAVDIANRTSADMNFNAMPDECEEIITVPVTANVHPVDAMPGQPIDVSVAFNEMIPLMQVWADGNPLIRTQVFGVPAWFGTIPADLRPGPQTVYFFGKDEIGAATYLATYQVQGISPVILEHPQDLTVTEGQDAVFHVVAEGTEPLSYQWLRDGVEIPGANEAQLVLTNLQLTDSGGYHAVVSNSAGAAESNVAQLTVEPAAPAFEFAAQEPNLEWLGEGLYALTPRVEITVGADTADEVPLDLVVYVNEMVHYDGRGEYTVQMRSTCEDEENCTGGCVVSVGGRRVNGTCQGSSPGCGCKVTSSLEAIQLALAPDDVVRIEFDPDDLVEEMDEANNASSITVPPPPVIQHDFSAQEIIVSRQDEGLYNLEPSVGIQVGADATEPVPLDYVILVNGELVHDGRGEYTVSSEVACENPEDCTGGCIASVNGETVQGTCFSGSAGCDCKVNASLGPVSLAVSPGDVVQVILDPDNAVPEFDEANNASFTAIPFMPPQLSLAYAETGVLVSWETPASNLVLQVALELSEPIMWMNEQREPELIDGRYQLEYSLDTDARFFRLAPTHIAAPSPLTVSGAIAMLQGGLDALLSREPDPAVREEMGSQSLASVDALLAKNVGDAAAATEELISYVEDGATSPLSRASFRGVLAHLTLSFADGTLIGFVSNDTDNDKKTNLADDDIDGDGQPNGDVFEKDIDGDGKPNDSDDDMDGDGAANGSDTDMDNDGKPNSDDDDIDSDGKSNQGPAKKTRPGAGDDADDDIDGDGIPDGTDYDIDGDGCLNSVDPDIDGDGIPNGDANEDDADGDGILDKDDKEPRGKTKPFPPGGQAPDRDGDGIPDGMDDDVDGDGKLNKADNDVDGDGQPNGEDDDVDGDGKGNSADDDVDGDGSINGADLDVDGDGTSNANDRDIDGDGIPNDQDPDMDGDGVPNENDDDMDGDDLKNGETDPDIDGDGTTNDVDPDVDGDGTANAMDDDVDGDGLANDEDDDDDGDGIMDRFDSTPQGL